MPITNGYSGQLDNPTAYQKWTSTHADKNNEFIRLQQNRVFKVPTGQYYQSRLSKIREYVKS